MCLILEWKTGLCVRAIEPWLSTFCGMTINLLAPPDSSSPPRPMSKSWWIWRMLVFCSEILMRVCCWSGYKRPNSVSNSRIHVASFAASVNAIYSTSVDNRVTVGCLLEYQLTGPPFSMKIKPEVDFRLSKSPAQSKSEYPLTKQLFLSAVDNATMLKVFHIPWYHFYSFSMLLARILDVLARNQCGKSNVWPCLHHREHQRPCHALVSFSLGWGSFSVSFLLEGCTFLHWSIDRVCLVEVELGEDFVDVCGLGQFDSLFLSVSLYI